MKYTYEYGMGLVKSSEMCLLHIGEKFKKFEGHIKVITITMHYVKKLYMMQYDIL